MDTIKVDYSKVFPEINANYFMLPDNQMIVKHIGGNIVETSTGKQYNGSKSYYLQDHNSLDKIFSGYKIDLYFVKYWDLNGTNATFKGKPIRQIEVDWQKQTENSQNTIVDKQYVKLECVKVFVDGVKRSYSVLWNPVDHKISVAWISYNLYYSETFKFKSIANSDLDNPQMSSISYSYQGGGYGEKYYVTNICIGSTFVGQYVGQYLTASFKNDLLYDSTDWLAYLTATDNWEVLVRYEQWEGYCVEGVKFIGNVDKLNALLQSAIDAFTGQKQIDWKDIKL